MSLRDCKLIDLPRINDPRGNLTFVEGSRHVPFDIRRIYYLYDVPGGAERRARPPGTSSSWWPCPGASTSFSMTATSSSVSTSIAPISGCTLRRWCGDSSKTSLGVRLRGLGLDSLDGADYLRDYQVFLQAIRRSA